MKLNIRRIIRLHKTLVIYSVLLIAGLICLFVGLIPAVQKSITLVQDLRTMEEDIVRIQKKVNIFHSLDQADLEQNAKETVAAIPADKSVDTLLSTIEAVATKNNLFISDMSIEGITFLTTGLEKQAVKPEEYSLTETITLQGELIQLRNFLSECVQVRRLMRVKDIKLTSMLNSNFFTVKLSIEVYYLPFPLSIGKPSDPLEVFSQKELATLEKIKSYPIMYAFDMQSISPQEAPVLGDVPTVPVVLDPFFSPKTNIVLIPLLSETPEEIPSESPSATQSSTPEPSLIVTPTFSP